MNLVKVISSRIIENKRLVKFLRMGASDVREKQEISPFGFDSNPIKDMIAVYSETGEVGKSVIIGYINKNQIAESGESRMYSTDDNGVLKMFLHLKKDGTAEFGGNTKNLTRFQELESGFNQLRTDLNNLVIAFNQHTHPTAPTGPISIPTPIPTVIPASNSTASISGAKIVEIYTW